MSVLLFSTGVYYLLSLITSFPGSATLGRDAGLFGKRQGKRSSTQVVQSSGARPL